MLLFFVLIIFFLLHIQFLFRNLVFGISELYYFDFLLVYPYDESVARSTLMFSLICTFAFAIGYQIAKKLTLKKYCDRGSSPYVPSKSVLRLTNFFSLIPILYMLILGIVTGFDYGSMVSIRETSTFIFELRMIFLVMLSYILLNSGVKLFFNAPNFRTTRSLLYVYIVLSLLFQARSLAFEVLSIIAFSHIVGGKDKIRLLYVIGVLISLVIPNVIVMGRLGTPDSPEKLLSGLFSFEYSILINKFLSAAVEKDSLLDTYSFIPTLQLIVPSPIRNLFGLVVEKSDYYSEMSDLANISSGGFSLLAEMYSNFGYYSSAVFLVMGAIMGHLNSKAMRLGRVSILTAIAPLLYASFILSFRNDLGVFLKYSVQLFFVGCLLYCFIPKNGKNAYRF